MSEISNQPFDDLLEAQIDAIGGCPVCLNRIVAPQLGIVSGCKVRLSYPECRAVKAGFALDDGV